MFTELHLVAGSVAVSQCAMALTRTYTEVCPWTVTAAGVVAGVVFGYTGFALNGDLVERWAYPPAPHPIVESTEPLLGARN